MQRADRVQGRPRDAPLRILEARGVSKVYQMGAITVNALDDVDVSVSTGEFVAVMGPSGSGKSTLLYLLGGLDRPSTGEIVLAGQQFSHLDDDQITLVRRRSIGFIFQFYNLIPTLTTEENVALPLLIDGRDLAGYREHIASLLELVGLQHRRDHKPDQLSGGQQQRVAIARALVTNPAIILGDEPTGNLDSKTGDEILTLLRHSSSQLGQTIVMVTHDPKAASFADRIVFLKDGRLVDELQLTGSGDTTTILQRFAALENDHVT